MVDFLLFKRRQRHFSYPSENRIRDHLEPELCNNVFFRQ